MTKRVAYFDYVIKEGDDIVALSSNKAYKVFDEKDDSFVIKDDEGTPQVCLKGVKNCAHLFHQTTWHFLDTEKIQKKAKKWSKWFKHTTGEQPVADDVLVKVKFSKDTDHTEIEYAGNWEWFKHEHDDDGAIRYYKVKLKDQLLGKQVKLEDLEKVSKPPKKPKNKWTKNTGVMPVDGNTKVKFKRRDGASYIFTAIHCDWVLNDKHWNIIKWRLAD